MTEQYDYNYFCGQYHFQTASGNLGEKRKQCNHNRKHAEFDRKWITANSKHININCILGAISIKQQYVIITLKI